jgi:hypothetical protein
VAAENTSDRPLSDFYSALGGVRAAPGGGPVNRAAIRSDAGLVFAKATSLLGYNDYLGDARSWKGRGQAVPAGFDRELQAQAAGALVDTHALASAALRMTNQYKQSGQLDGMLSGCISTLGQVGSVATSDLVADLRQAPSLRETLKDEGVTDELWESLLTNLTHIDADLFERGGKLAADVKVAGQDKPRTIVLVPTATGMPQTLSDLLGRGTFERMAPHFIRNGGANLYLLPTPPRDLELPEVVLAAAMLSVESMAAHTRGLQDAGLAEYTGSALVVIWAVAALAALVIGYLLFDKYCPKDPNAPRSAACIAGTILIILGALGSGLLLLGAFDLILGPSSGETGCASGVYYYSPIDGSSGCGERSLPLGGSTMGP